MQSHKKGVPDATYEAARTLLNSRSLRATQQRIALVDALSASHAPLSMQQLAERIGESADLSTLYRSMHSLVEHGLARQVDVRHAHAHFELMRGDEHHHLICTSCGTTEEFVWKGCKQLERKALAAASQFATVEDHSLELYGRCKRCVTR